MGPLQKEKSDLVTWVMEKAEALNHFFALLFTSKSSSHPTQIPEDKSRDWENEKPSSVGNQGQDHLKNLKVHKSIGADERHAGAEGTGRWSGWATTPEKK